MNLWALSAASAYLYSFRLALAACSTYMPAVRVCKARGDISVRHNRDERSRAFWSSFPADGVSSPAPCGPAPSGSLFPLPRLSAPKSRALASLVPSRHNAPLQGASLGRRTRPRSPVLAGRLRRPLLRRPSQTSGLSSLTTRLLVSSTSCTTRPR